MAQNIEIRNEVGHFRGEKLKFYSECEILGHPYKDGKCQICGKIENDKKK